MNRRVIPYSARRESTVTESNPLLGTDWRPRSTSLDNTQVVILGQDPYQGTEGRTA
jgi:uracil DNA glycosylase